MERGRSNPCQEKRYLKIKERSPVIEKKCLKLTLERMNPTRYWRRNMLNRMNDEIGELKEKLIHYRRDFHQHPELGLEETRTAGIVADRLEQLGLTVSRNIGQTGVVGLLEGGGPGKTLMLRADMDALPIQEENDVPYRSQNPGVMHACGHDGHTAILLTVAEVLSTHREEFPGRVKFVFQPGEEGFAGAKLMIEDGVLEDPLVDAAFGLHITTAMPVGVMATCDGPIMASMDSFTITLTGKAAHAAHADMGVDAIVMTSEVVSALQTLISREVSPTIPLVLHIGTIQGGTAFNVVAENVELKGTVRTFDEGFRASMPDRMNRLIGGVATAMKGSHQLDYKFGCPVLINDGGLTQLLKESIIEIIGNEGFIDLEPRMVSEDMAFFHQKVPGSYFYLGAANVEKGINTANHNPRFDFDENALVLGAQAMARVAWNFLSSSL